MTTFNDVFPSKYLAKEDVRSPIVATIQRIELNNVAGQGKPAEQKPVISFDGNVKPMVCNKTNWKVLASAYGPAMEGWIGKQIEIYVNPDVTDLKGNIVGGLRFRLPHGTAPSNGAAWTWAHVIEQCSAVGLNEEEVRRELRESGRTTYSPNRDTPFIQQLIADATSGFAGDEIPI